MGPNFIVEASAKVRQGNCKHNGSRDELGVILGEIGVLFDNKPSVVAYDDCLLGHDVLQILL